MLLRLYPSKQAKRTGNDAVDVDSLQQQNEIISLLIPPKPDFIPNQNVHKAIATVHPIMERQPHLSSTMKNLAISHLRYDYTQSKNAANASIVQQ